MRNPRSCRSRAGDQALDRLHGRLLPIISITYAANRVIINEHLAANKQFNPFRPGHRRMHLYGKSSVQLNHGLLIRFQRFDSYRPDSVDGFDSGLMAAYRMVSKSHYRGNRSVIDTRTTGQSQSIQHYGHADTPPGGCVSDYDIHSGCSRTDIRLSYWPIPERVQKQNNLNI